MTQTVAIPKEIHPNERRVAATPETAQRIRKLGFEVTVEAGAGVEARFSDQAYQQAGCRIVDDTRALWQSGDIVLKVRAPEAHAALGLDESELLNDGATLVSFVWPAQNPGLMERLQARRATVLAMDAVPRISRAQKLDALSSTANIAGYRAVIEAATHFGRFFTGQITAAGKVPPAKVMIIGAGVAGLAAIGTAGSLGAIVRAFDTRPEVKQQVESMGAEFLQLDYREDDAAGTDSGYAKEMSQAFIDAEMALFRAQAKDVDIIVTTALVPGKPAPRLITADMVQSMRDGSVVVDLAAEQGGNCELTEPGEVVVKHGVTLIGYTDLASRLPTQASQLYGTNLWHLLTELCPEKNGEIQIDMDDPVVRGTTVIKDGEITWPPPALAVSAATPQAPPPERPIPEAQPGKARGFGTLAVLLLGGLALFGLGRVAPAEFMSHFTVFVLACFVGYQVVWNVTPALHTPLMSVTNAISGIIVIGALLQVSSSSGLVAGLAVVATLIATINIAGGFLVTHRMLQMFRKD